MTVHEKYPTSPNSSTGQTTQSNQTQTSSQSKPSRPKLVIHWSALDVQKWLRRNCGDYYHLYSEFFLDQDITGRSLVRLNENSLLRLGIVHPDHRQSILRAVAKLRLRYNIVALRDIERK